MVSVIIPVYNVEKYIARCLDSVINQTYRDLEIIVVNDATPDNSMEIVEEYAAKDYRIRIVNNPRNMGLMMTRKNGYTIAKGDYITFVDSDDYVPARAVELMFEKAEETNSDIVAGTIRYIKNDGIFEDWKGELPYGNESIGVYKALLNGLFTHNLCGKLFRSFLLKKYMYNSYDNMTNAEDACLFYQLVENCKHVESTSGIVYMYCQNSESSMNRKFTPQQVQNIITFDKTLTLYETKFPVLRKEFHHSITYSLVKLFLHGIPMKTVHKMIRESGLAEYTTIKNILCSLTTHEILYYFKIGILSFIR